MAILYQYTIKLRSIIFLILCISCLPRAAYTQLKITNLVPDKPFATLLSNCTHAIKKWDNNGFFITHFTMENDTFPPYQIPCANGIQLYEISDSGDIIKKYHFKFFEINKLDSALIDFNSVNKSTMIFNPEQYRLVVYFKSRQNTFSLKMDEDSTYYLSTSPDQYAYIRAEINIQNNNIQLDTIIDPLNLYISVGPPDNLGCNIYSNNNNIGKLCPDTNFAIKIDRYPTGIWMDTIICINSNKWGIYFAKYNFSGEQIGKTDTMLHDTIDSYEFHFNQIQGFSVFPNQRILCRASADATTGAFGKNGIAIFDNNFNLVNIVFSSYEIISNHYISIDHICLTSQNTFIVAGNLSGYKNIWMMEFTPEGEILWEHIYPYGFSFPPNTVHDIIAEEDALYLLMSNWKENFSDNPEYYQYWFVKFTRDGLGGTLSNEQTEPLVIDNVLATVYPNPSNGLYYLNLFTPARELSYRVFDVNGTLITSGKIQGASQGEIDIRDHPPGMYFISLIDTERKQVQTLKLIKMN